MPNIPTDRRSTISKSMERYLAFGFGIVFVVVLLILAIKFPNPTPFQYTVFRIILALASGGVAAMIPGFLTVQVSTKLRTGGALAVFVIVYFYSPAGLTGVKVKTEQQIEIEKPVVNQNKRPEKEGPMSVPAVFVPVVYAQPSSPLPNLTVTRADQLLLPDVWKKHYQSLTINGVHAEVARRATLVANEVTAINGGGLTGSEFSVVARHMANVTIDVSGSRKPGASASAVRLYVKLVENSRILANGSQGTSGTAGAAGANGPDGANGTDGNCGCCGAYRGAKAGANGGDGGNGTNGQPGDNGQSGGLVVLTTIENPVSSTIDVSGGQPGQGGAGGNPGSPGRGGTGGRGCTGLGGSQPNEADGHAGRPGQPGSAGQPGLHGAPGEYRLQIVPTFDPIAEKVKTLPNDQLHDALQKL
jgi:hypothetical protein